MAPGFAPKPPGFDPSRSYPMLDDISAGPYAAYVPRTLGGVMRRFGMAASGFVVVIDGRGTPGRRRDFASAGCGAIGAHEIAEHAAALRQAAASRPYMDLSRVGVFGWSWGGYFAVRAMLQALELNRAGVAIAGPADLERFRASIEPYMGCLPRQCPDAYAAGSNTRPAGRLAGNLLLIHGTSDDDVPLGETLRLADALARAGKPFDMLLLQEDDHQPVAQPAVRDRPCDALPGRAPGRGHGARGGGRRAGGRHRLERLTRPRVRDGRRVPHAGVAHGSAGERRRHGERA